MKPIEFTCHRCGASFWKRRSWRGTRTKLFCADYLDYFIGAVEKRTPTYQWHNVKPTPPGTVKMLTAMSEEIERYLEAKAKQ